MSPHQIRPSMGLNCVLGDKSENLRRMNNVEKFNKTNRKKKFAEKARFLEYYMHILAFKNGDNRI